MCCWLIWHRLELKGLVPECFEKTQPIDQWDGMKLPESQGRKSGTCKTSCLLWTSTKTRDLVLALQSQNEAGWDEIFPRLEMRIMYKCNFEYVAESWASVAGIMIHGKFPLASSSSFLWQYFSEWCSSGKENWENSVLWSSISIFSLVCFLKCWFGTSRTVSQPLNNVK